MSVCLSNRRLLRRLLVTAPVALALLAGAVAVSIAGATRYDNPEVALRFMPGDAVANARLADRLLLTDGPLDRTAITAAAMRALRRTPLSPEALRILALLADDSGHHASAGRLIYHAAALSRRDFGTRLWLIEEAIARDDVDGALNQFDIALRTTAGARDVLFPALGRAIADREFVPAFVKLFERGSDWQRDFVVGTLQGGQATETVTAILERMHPPRNQALARSYAEAAITQLTNERRYAALPRFLASPLAAAAGVRDRGRSTTRLDNLAEAEGLFPFVWVFTREAGYGATPASGGLDVTADSGGGGVVAARLMLLTPGRYNFSTTGGSAGDAGAGQIGWTVACAGVPERLLADLLLPAGRRARVATAITVPDDCRAQWVRLTIAPTGRATGFGGRVASVRIDPVDTKRD